MEDPYIHTLESIDTSHNNAIFSDEYVATPDDPQPANKSDEAPRSSPLLIRSDDVDIETFDQIIKLGEKDIGELSGKTCSFENLDGHSLSSQQHILLQSLRSQTK